MHIAHASKKTGPLW